MILPTMMLGLAVAVCWGSADTLATFVARRLGTAATTLIAQVAGLVLAAVIALLVGLPALSTHTLALSFLFGVALGAVAALAYVTLYRALALGPLAVASPLVSAQGGVTLVLALLVLHEAFSQWQLAFLILTFAGVMMATVCPREITRASPRSWLSPGVALALVSMLCFGILAFGLGVAARESNWLLTVVWTRMVSCLLLAVFLRPSAQAEANISAGTKGGWLVAAALVGSLDMGGLLMLALASLSGSLGVLGMVASAYGVIPLVVGIVVLHERPALSQMVGMIWLVGGLIGLAAPMPHIANAVLTASGAGTLILVLFGVGRRWLQRRATRRAARTAEPSSIVQKLRGYASGDASAMLASSVLLCGAVSRPDDPYAPAAEEIARLLARAGFRILIDKGAGFLDVTVSTVRDGGVPLVHSGNLLTEGRKLDARDGTERETDVLPHLLPVARMCAFVVFPGGLEPLAALIEALRAMQAGALDPAPLILYGSMAWQGLRDWLKSALIEATLIDLVQLSDESAEIVSLITATRSGALSGTHPSLELGSASIAAASL